MNPDYSNILYGTDGQTDESVFEFRTAPETRGVLPDKYEINTYWNGQNPMTLFSVRIEETE
jgi:hypothetical protein